MGRRGLPFGAALLVASVTIACAVEQAGAAPGPRLGARTQSTYVVKSAGTLGPTVTPKVAGEILGFDIDRNGTDGLLANYRDLRNGSTETSVEIFDQLTGKITSVVYRGTSAGYAVAGTLAGDIGLLYTSPGFALMNPVTGGKINGTWTPPPSFYVAQVAENQATPEQVILGYDGSQASQPTALAVTDVLRGTARILLLDQSVFGTGDVPVIAQDPKTNQAVVAGGNGAPNTHPKFGIVNLRTGKTATFTGLGYGLVNGLDVDPKTGIACATTELDAGVEFFNLRTHTGFEVQIPNSGGQQIHSGSGVAMDSQNGLCIIAQPVSGNGTQASALWVADEKGNFLEEITGFNFWWGVGPAINPSRRIGYVLNPRPTYMTLTGFTY